MLLFSLVSPHTGGFQIEPQMANYLPFYCLENILCLTITCEIPEQGGITVQGRIKKYILMRVQCGITAQIGNYKNSRSP